MTEDFIPWDYDRVNTGRRLREQGTIYDAINEVVQNAVDSAAKPLLDNNNVLITIPCLGDPDYGRILLRVQDFGKGVTRDYDGNIFAFLRGKKSVSPKADYEDTIGRNGVGMVQYLKISKEQIVTTMDDKMIYRFKIVLDEQGGIGYTLPEQEPISEESKHRFNIFTQGTIVEFLKSYANQLDIEPRKAVNEIKKKFGWRMMMNNGLQILVNEIRLEVPDYLENRKPIWLCRLAKAMIENSNGKLVERNPDVYGFLYEDKQGVGNIKIHVKGYYIQEYNFAAKRCSGAINVDYLGIDTSRKTITDEKMLADLERHMMQLMAKFPNIKTDNEKVNEKKQRKIGEMINKMLSKYNLPKRWMLNEVDKLRKKTEQLGDKKGNDVAGYGINESEKHLEKFQKCELCDHMKLRSKKWRKICKCECHARIRSENKHIMRVGIDGTDLTRRESDSDEDKKNKRNIALHFNDEMDPVEELLTAHPMQSFIEVNEKNKLFDYCFLEVKSEIEIIRRITPFLATIVMDAEHPTYIHEVQELKEFRQMHSKYYTEMLAEIGEI